jgi:hypothetical protein
MKYQVYKPGAFEPETTEAMGKAFDAAIKDLRDTCQPQFVREIIALRIIEAATLGEHDPIRLRDAALPWITFNGH